MKRLSKTLITLLALVYLAACKEMDDTLTTNFGVTLNLNFGNVDQANYEGIALADAGSDKDFRQNKDKIRDLQIDKITYRITNPVTEVAVDTIEYAALYFTDGAETFEPILLTEVKQPVLVKKMALDQEFILNKEAKTKLTDLFKKSPYSAKIYYRAQFNKGRNTPPADFSVLVKVYLDVKAGL